MAKILVATSGLKGLMLSSFALSKRIEKMGHEVFWGCPIDNSDWAESNALNYFQLPNVFEDKLSQSAANDEVTRAKVNLLTRLARFCSRYLSYPSRLKTSIAKRKTNEISERLEAGQFDLLICDLEVHEIILSAFAIKLKTVLLSPWFTLNECQSCPPLNSLTLPERGMNYSNEWESLRRSNRSKEMRHHLRTGFVSRKIALKKTARRISFPTSSWVEYLWPQPFFYNHLPVISMVLEELEFPSAEKSQMVYVGPMIDDNRQAPIQTSDEFDIDHFMKQKKLGKKIVLVTVTTFEHDTKKLFDNLNAAAKRNPEWEIILAPCDIAADQSEMADNLHCCAWVPQLEVLRIADLSVNHGGINTINECIHFGVPMLIYSGQKHDQNGCTSRSGYHRIARLGENLDQIEVAINEALHDQELRKRIVEMQTIAESYVQDGRLEKFISSVLNG